jgi:hypothetical protein
VLINIITRTFTAVVAGSLVGRRRLPAPLVTATALILGTASSATRRGWPAGLGRQPHRYPWCAGMRVCAKRRSVRGDHLRTFGLNPHAPLEPHAAIELLPGTSWTAVCPTLPVYYIRSSPVRPCACRALAGRVRCSHYETLSR